VSAATFAFASQCRPVTVVTEPRPSCETMFRLTVEWRRSYQLIRKSDFLSSVDEN
jgi:hypothetical protein